MAIARPAESGGPMPSLWIGIGRAPQVSEGWRCSFESLPREARLRGLPLDHDFSGRRVRQRVEQLGREALARIPKLKPEHATGGTISFDQAGLRLFHSDTVLVPAVKAKPGDVRFPVVVTIHCFSGYSSSHSVTTRAIASSPRSGQL
jgi:hypothetical protein